MKTKINRMQAHNNYLFSVLNSIEKLLLKSFISFTLLLLISQVMLYYKIGSEYLNSVYKMEGNIFSAKPESIYNIFCIYGEIPESDNVWVLKNGVPINQITSDTPVYIYLFEGDVVEIDATCTSGIPREIFIENTTSTAVPNGFPDKLILTDKLYRFQPFSQMFWE